MKPVAPAHVAAVLPFLNRHVWAMVELQRHTGMRPGEVYGLTLADLDRTGDVWIYRPSRHKTAHRKAVRRTTGGYDTGRVVAIGPRGQAAITGLLAGLPPVVLGPDDPVFSPVRERAERFAALRAARKSKVQPSQLARKKANSKRVPAAEYHPHAYGNAVAKAAKSADVPRWSPNQLRHLFATEVRREHGLEVAQVLLGHSRADVTQVYAERDMALAAVVAGEVG